MVLRNRWKKYNPASLPPPPFLSVLSAAPAKNTLVLDGAGGVLLLAVLLAPLVALVVLGHALLDVGGGEVELLAESLVVVLGDVDVVVLNRRAGNVPPDPFTPPLKS